MNTISSLVSRPPVLFVGDAVAATGFARVMHSLCEMLQSDYDIHQIAINYHGDPHDCTWRIYPAKLGGDAFGVGRLLPMVESVRPAFIFLLNDLWILADYMDRLRTLPHMPKVVMYCPVDAGPIEPSAIERLEGVDRFVVYTEFAKGEIEAALAGLRRQRPDFAFPAIEVIAHGVDTALFHPLSPDSVGEFSSPGRRQAISSIFGDDPEMEDAFIVLNANRNQPRKRIDLTIKGFAQFAAGKPANVKLHLHMGVTDAGWNVVHLARRYRIDERIILTTNGDNLPSVPIAQLNAIYNAAAVGINTSIGEGWGLVSFEHAATGAAQIVPRHSACAELWQDAALMVEPAMSLTTESMLTEGHYVSPEGVAAALQRLYEDRALLRDLSQAAYRNATRPEYRWSLIARQWHRLFQAVLNASA
jgi:D-inositol-3-phosphate glycosyltransferase